MVAAAEIKLVDGERLSRPGSSTDLDRGNSPDSKTLEKSAGVKSLFICHPLCFCLVKWGFLFSQSKGSFHLLKFFFFHFSTNQGPKVVQCVHGTGALKSRSGQSWTGGRVLNPTLIHHKVPSLPCPRLIIAFCIFKLHFAPGFHQER